MKRTRMERIMKDLLIKQKRGRDFDNLFDEDLKTLTRELIKGWQYC